MSRDKKKEEKKETSVYEGKGKPKYANQDHIKSNNKNKQ